MAIVSIKGIVFSNLNWTSQVALRLKPEESGLPGWFGYPIKCAGYDFRCDKTPFGGLLRALVTGKRCILLCFNPSFTYFFLFLMPLPIKKISLFQWRPLGRLPRSKAIVVWLTLWRSHEIVVYSNISARYLRRIFPDKRIRQIGLYADEKFFCARHAAADPPFIFAPGDHKREEQLLGDIADRMGLRVVRVTRNMKVRAQIEALAHPLVDLRYNVSFDELRHLYQSCRVVLILSDASEIPTGITTLAEALSCGANVVISRGHSNSWPMDNAHSLPFTLVPPDANLDEVIAAIGYQTCDVGPEDSPARKFALEHLSSDALARDWSSILDDISVEKY